MQIGSLIIHAFGLDSDGELLGTEAGKMGVYNTETQELVIPTNISLDGEVVINKT